MTALAIAVGSVRIVMLGDDASSAASTPASSAPAAKGAVTLGGAGGFDTGTLRKGDEQALRLEKPGTYAYICALHPFMKATVVVE